MQTTAIKEPIHKHFHGSPKLPIEKRVTKEIFPEEKSKATQHETYKPKTKNEGFNIAKYANGFSVGLNSLSILTNAYDYLFNKKNSSSKKTEGFLHYATKGGETGTKFLYIVNAIQKVVECFNNGDYAAMAGYFNDLPIAGFVQQINIFLWRAISAGLYTFANGVKKSVNKRDFKDIGENANAIVSGIKSIFTELSKGPKNFWNKFWDSTSGIQSMVAGLTIMSSLPVWKIFGFKFAANILRDLGGIMQDFEQMKPNYMLTEDEKVNLPFISKLWLSIKRGFGFGEIKEGMQPLYYRSGIGVTLGTIFDWIKALLEKAKASEQLINIFTSLTYVADGAGIYLLGRWQETELAQQIPQKIISRKGLYLS